MLLRAQSSFRALQFVGRASNIHLQNKANELLHMSTNMAPHNATTTNTGSDGDPAREIFLITLGAIVACVATCSLAYQCIKCCCGDNGPCADCAEVCCNHCCNCHCPDPHEHNMRTQQNAIPFQDYQRGEQPGRQSPMVYHSRPESPEHPLPAYRREW